MRRQILASAAVLTFVLVAACASPGELDADGHAYQLDEDAHLVAAQGPGLVPDQIHDLQPADLPQIPAWEYLDAASLGELTEGIPATFSGSLGHQGYSVGRVIVPGEGQLRVDPSYCGAGNTGCVVYVAVDRDGDTMLEASEVEAYADGRLGEVAEAAVDGGVWWIFVTGSVPEVDGFVVEVLWSVPGGSDGTAS